MIEIRVCWSILGRENALGKPIQGGLWSPDTLAARQVYESVVKEGNSAYGVGTHWLVQRKA